MDPEALMRLLHEQGWLDAQEAGQLLAEIEEHPERTFDLLECAGLGTKPEILKCIAEARGLEFVDLAGSKLPEELLAVIPAHIMQIYRCIPVHDANDVLKICVVDPLDDVALAELSGLIGRPVQPVVGDPDIIEDLLASRVVGAAKESPLLDATPRTLVAASMGSDGQSVEGKRAAFSRGNLWVFAVALLAFSSAGTVAIYLHQSRTSPSANELLEEIKSAKDETAFDKKAADRMLVELEQKIDKLGQDLSEASAGVIRLEQLQMDVKRMEGRLEALQQLLPQVMQEGGDKEAQVAE